MDKLILDQIKHLRNICLTKQLNCMNILFKTLIQRFNAIA